MTGGHRRCRDPLSRRCGQGVCFQSNSKEKRETPVHPGHDSLSRRSCFHQKYETFPNRDILGAADLVVLSLSGKFGGVANMVESWIALEDVIHKGFEELVSNKDNHIKILVMLKRENLQIIRNFESIVFFFFIL
jgi:hypothetical protein